MLAIVVTFAYIVWTNHRGTRAIQRLEARFAGLGLPDTVDEWERRSRGLSIDEVDIQFRAGGDRMVFVATESNGARYYRAASELMDLSPQGYGNLPFVSLVDPPEPTERVHPQLMSGRRASNV